MTQQITMGAGLTAPEGAITPTSRETTSSGRHRRLLGNTAIASPILFTAFVGIDPGPLPREPAPDFIGAIAAHPTPFVVATSLQFAAMATGVALAVYIVLAMARRAPVLAPLVGTLLTLGYLGGSAFDGAKMIAANMVVDGAPRDGALDIWSAVHTGPLFNVLSWPLAMAIPGNFLLALLLFRNRGIVSAWPAAAVLAGFVMGSGEFPDVVTLAGWAIQVPAVVHVVRRTLRTA